MAEPKNAIFLSYASEDAAAALRLYSALRAAGIEVWFDQNELRGGDAWDASIRQQIRNCALFIPVISASSQARAEGYFRLEWKLAVDRSHLMAADKAFLLPVVIDDTRDASARVPDRFRELQPPEKRRRPFSNDFNVCFLRRNSTRRRQSESHPARHMQPPTMPRSRRSPSLSCRSQTGARRRIRSTFLQVHIWLVPVRGDARYRALLRKMNFPE